MVIKYNYIIYHKNCLDGYSGFFLFNRLNLTENNTTIYPDVPSSKKIPPNIINKNVIIIDVAYSTEILEQIFASAKNVLFIDHHITTMDYSVELAKKYGQKVYFDEKFSGVGLVWNLFYKEEMPQFVKYIQDSDMGIWMHTNTRPFISALQIKYKTDQSKETLDEWEKLFNPDKVKKLIDIGLHYEEYKNHLLEQSLKKYTIEYFPSQKLLGMNPKLKKLINKPGKYKVAVFNGGCPTISSIGAYMMDNIKCDFVMVWNMNLGKKEIIVSLRSKNTSVNIEEIATCFGGGGHYSAAAFSFSIYRYNMQDLFK